MRTSMKSSSIEGIKREALKRIKPKKEEREKINELCDELLKALSRIAKGEVILAGSIAKDTFLSGDRDIDIFIVYDREMSEKELKKEIRNIGRRIFGEIEERYAQHPYVHAIYKGFEVDLVPAFRFSGRIKSSVDRTPEHTKFVLQHTDEKMRDEIRILKQFAKGIGIYGAEARVQGLSGYLCELLIIRFGDFEAFMEKAKNFKEGEVISFNGSWKKEKSALVFIDPVDSERNVAASLSLENLEFLRLAAREFLKRPGITFFFPNEPSLDEKYPEDRIFAVDVSEAIELRIEDIYFPQLRKTANSIAKALEEFGVEKKAIYCEGDRAILFFLLEKKKLDRIKEHTGPPLGMEQNVREFIKKWGRERCYVKDGRLYARIEREAVTPEQALQREQIGIGKYMKKEKIKAIEKLPEETKIFLIKQFSGKKPWEF